MCGQSWFAHPTRSVACPHVRNGRPGLACPRLDAFEITTYLGIDFYPVTARHALIPTPTNRIDTQHGSTNQTKLVKREFGFLDLFGYLQSRGSGQVVNTD